MVGRMLKLSVILTFQIFSASAVLAAPTEHMELKDIQTEAKVYEIETNHKEYTTEFGQKHLLVNDKEDERLLEG